MKKYFLGVLTGFIVCTMLVSAVAIANSPIRLIVNGNVVKSDVPPQIIDGRTMVPARPLAEALGATVQWDDANYAVVVTGGVQAGAVPTDLEPVNNKGLEDITVEEIAKNYTIKINGKERTLIYRIENSNDVFVMGRGLVDILSDALETEEISLSPDCVLKIGNTEYNPTFVKDEDGLIFYSMMSLNEAGIASCIWDSENTNLIVTKNNAKSPSTPE